MELDTTAMRKEFDRVAKDRILGGSFAKEFTALDAEGVGVQKKLEELDIDDVLENAEEHKTEQPEGMTTDGGEEFLRSFEYTDVKIDLEWDEIIPKEQLDKIKEEERKRKEEEYLESVIEQNQPRKRKAPVDEAREVRAGN